MHNNVSASKLLFMLKDFVYISLYQIVAMRLFKSCIVFLLSIYGYYMHVFVCKQFLYLTEIWKGWRRDWNASAQAEAYWRRVWLSVEGGQRQLDL